MVSLCSFAMCLRTISEYRKRAPQMRHGETQRFKRRKRSFASAGSKLRVTGSLTLIVGGTMQNTIITFEEGSAEAIALREQDDAFCRRLRIAIERGSEFCPTAVNAKPCSTGISAGFAPRRILSTESPARRNRAVKLTP